jgi:hypothetical protein
MFTDISKLFFRQLYFATLLRPRIAISNKHVVIISFMSTEKDFDTVKQNGIVVTMVEVSIGNDSFITLCGFQNRD